MKELKFYTLEESHKLIIINDGEINAWGNIRCDSIVWERLTNW